jgi:hypothetical protein
MYLDHMYVDHTRTYGPPDYYNQPNTLCITISVYTGNWPGQICVCHYLDDMDFQLVSQTKEIYCLNQWCPIGICCWFVYRPFHATVYLTSFPIYCTNKRDLLHICSHYKWRISPIHEYLDVHLLVRTTASADMILVLPIFKNTLRSGEQMFCD